MATEYSTIQQCTDNNSTNSVLITSPLHVSRLHIDSACNQISNIVESISDEQSTLKQQMNQVIIDLKRAKSSIDDLVTRFEEISNDHSNDSKSLKQLIKRVDSHEIRIQIIEKRQQDGAEDIRKKSSLGYHSLDGSRQNSATILEEQQSDIPNICITEPNP